MLFNIWMIIAKIGNFIYHNHTVSRTDDFRQFRQFGYTVFLHGFITIFGFLHAIFQELIHLIIIIQNPLFPQIFFIFKYLIIHFFRI